MYITFRHKFQHSFVAKAKTIHRYLYILVIQNQFLHFCTCTMYSQLCIGSFCVQQFFSKGEGAEKLLKYKFSWKLFSQLELSTFPGFFMHHFQLPLNLGESLLCQPRANGHKMPLLLNGVKVFMELNLHFCRTTISQSLPKISIFRV